MMYVMNTHMMHALMHWNFFNSSLETKNWLEQRILGQKPQILKNLISKFKPNLAINHHTS